METKYEIDGHIFETFDEAYGYWLEHGARPQTLNVYFKPVVAVQKITVDIKVSL